MTRGQSNDLDADAIEPGMDVEANRGDLGEEDISKPKVVGVERGRDGQIEKVTVEKGTIFRKKLDVPIDRVQGVQGGSREEPGKVTIDARETELEGLNTVGEEQLADERDLLSQVESTIPTAEAVRGLEAEATRRKDKQSPGEEQSTEQTSSSPWWRTIGPGFLGGMAGNDASAVTAYSIDGAQNGFGHLWLMLLATPMYYAVMYTCAKLGRVTEKGLADVLREHYGRWVAVLAAVILVVANIALIAADLVAIGSGLQIVTGISWVWFVVPVGLILWYLTVFRSFESIKRIFVALSLAFVVYIVTAFLAHPALRAVLWSTFVPHIDFNFASISSAVALLGATISPYNIFWQVQGEKEESRAGTKRHQMRMASVDVAVGVISGNLIAYFIIITTAATLFVHHKGITTASDAALALTSVLGPFAKYLFAAGLIGAGVVAIPVLLAGTSYAVAGTFGWPYGLSKKPWQNEGFYLILSLALVISLVMALVRFDPIQLMFWANILSGVLAPILVVYLIFLANNRRVMHGRPINWLTTAGLVLTCIVMAGAAVLLFYGLATGQGS